MANFVSETSTTHTRTVQLTEIDKISAFITEFGGQYRTYTIEANTMNAAILELSGLVDSYYGGSNTTGDPLLAGWLLCMINRRMIRAGELFSANGYSFRLLQGNDKK